MKTTELSIVIPVYNEAESINELYRKLTNVLVKINKTYEIIFIDDGSNDLSSNVIKNIRRHDKKVNLIVFLRNYGQTAAMSAGFDYSKGKIIVTIDSDLQNDPRDIPKLINKLNEGYGVVSGWRKERHKESILARMIPSVLANKLISFLLGLELHDFGCTLKAYKREYVKPLKLYGEMHRFIPAYAMWLGAKVTEIPISYSVRKHGKSKYNIMRTYKVILDLLTVKFLEKFITKPIYVFGVLGFLSFLAGVFSVIILVYNKVSRGVSMIQSPILLLSALFVILGTMFLCMGLLAELLVRTYYESQDKKAYVVKN